MGASRLLHSAVLIVSVCCAGCLDLAYAQMDYSETKARIRETHADVTIRGKVVDEQGQPLPGILRPAGHARGTFAIIGVREKVHFQMKGEGEGLRLQVVDAAGWFGERFEARLQNVKAATVFFTRDGYEPAWVEAHVAPAAHGRKRAVPLVLDDVKVTLRRLEQSSTAGAPALRSP